MKINLANLDALIKRINEVTNSPAKSYTRGKRGANIGNYFLQGAYGGHQLQKILSSGGAVSTPLGGGFCTKREMWDKLQAFLVGLEL